MTKIAILPGTFDPFTLGHHDLILRSAQIFEKLIVAVASNTNKKPLLSLEQRIALLQNATSGLQNVTVLGYNGLLVDFAREQDAKIIVRSLRGITDLEYELQLANMNRAMSAKVETVFLSPNHKYVNISSTLVREIAQLGGDISPFVSPEVVTLLKSVKWH